MNKIIKNIFECIVFLKSTIWQIKFVKCIFPGFPNYVSSFSSKNISGKVIYSTVIKGFVRTHPKSIEPKINEVFSSQYILKDKKSFVYSISNGRVLSEFALLIDSKNNIVDNDIDFFDSDRQHPIFRKIFLPKKTKLDDSVAVLLPVNNYFHWMFEVVPRIKLLIDSGVKVDYFMTSLGKKYQNETLEKVGIFKKTIAINESSNFEVKEIIVPSIPIFPGNPTKETAAFLRKLFLDKSTTKDKRFSKIYVKRGGINRRIVTNESEVIKYVEKLGFTPVVLDNLSISEQAKIFNSAKVVLAAHGAALSNLVFCDKGTKVIEFFNPDYVNPCFWAVSNCVDLDYNYFTAEKSDFLIKKLNIKVDINKLDKALNFARVN